MEPTAGQEIRDAREARGLSRRALAEHLKVGESTIKLLEESPKPPKKSRVLPIVQEYLRVGPYSGAPDRRFSPSAIHALPDDELVEVHQVAGAELFRRFIELSRLVRAIDPPVGVGADTPSPIRPERDPDTVWTPNPAIQQPKFTEPPPSRHRRAAH